MTVLKMEKIKYKTLREEITPQIRGTLSEYHHQPVTPTLIDAIVRQLSEDIEKLLRG